MSTAENHKVNSIIKLNNVSKPNSSILTKNVHVNIFTPQSEPSTSKTLFPKTQILTPNKIRSHTIKSTKAESSILKSTQNAQSSHVIDMITQTDQTEKDRWKDLKLFSKTLSSIDAKSHRNDKKTNQIGSIKSESEPNSANRANSMKGAKGNTKIEHNNFTFQMATISSSLSSSSSSSSAGQPKKQSEWKTLKSKLSLLRKKDVEFGFEYKDKSISSMMRNENEASGSNIKQKSSYKNRSNEDEIMRKSGEDGVVWKMQDLMFLISQSKQMRDKIKEKDLEQKQLELKEQQEKSILTKENSNSSLKKVCSTKKQRNSGPESSEFREDVEEEQQNVNTNCQQANKCVCKSNSCEGLTGKTECVQKANEFQEIKRESSEKYHLRKNSDKKPTKQISKEEQNKDYNETTKVTEIDTMTSGSEFDDEAKCCVKKHASDSDVIQPDPKPSSSSSSGLEQVQWDEANYVDPTLIGDAIQAILKGLNTPSNSEKRVSFKKMS